MTKINYIIEDPLEVNKNNRRYTKECWDAIINSEKNAANAIPVVSHTAEFEYIANPSAADMLGVAHLDWTNNKQIEVNLTLKDDVDLGKYAVVPAWTIDESGMTNIESIDVVSGANLEYFFPAESSAFKVAYIN